MDKIKKSKMSSKDKWTLAILVLMSVFLFADQNAINPIVNDLVNEYGVNEAKIGFVGSAFTLIGAIISLIFGYLADRHSRKKLLIFVVLIGEIPCFLTGFRLFTNTYEQLLLLRILTGLGVGGIFPLTYSLIGDYFSAEHRSFVNALIGSAWGIGQVLGQVMAGFLAGPFGWRLPFIIAAAPNFLLVPLFMVIASEPKRGAKEEEISELIEQGMIYNEKMKLKDFKIIFKNKTNVLNFIQGIPGCIPWGLLAFFLIPYYEIAKGFSKEAATVITMVIGLGSILGSILGGWLGDRIYRKSPRMLPIFSGIIILIGVIPSFYLMSMEVSGVKEIAQMIKPLIAGFCMGFMIILPGPNAKAILLNVNPPEQRGSVFAIHNLSDCIGKGLGPALGGLLIGVVGYKYTMYISVLMWIPCGIIYMMMSLTINKDLRRLNEHLKDKRNKMLSF